MNSLARKTTSSAAINVGVTLFKTLLQFVIVLPILARIIPPAEFGLVGMALAFVTFFTMLNDFGISAALVRAAAPSRAFWASAFWTNTALGAGLTTLAWFGAGAIAAFYNEPRVGDVMRALSIVLFLHCLFLVPMAWLQRHFRFRAIAIIEITSTILSAALAIWLASRGAGVWALVAQQIAVQAIKTALTFVFQRAPIAPAYDWSEIAAVLPFSLRLTGAGFVTFLSRNMDSILIGRVLGAEALGFYGRAYQIMQVPVRSLAGGANFALYPALSSLQADTAKLHVGYRASLALLTLITTPMMVGLSLVAEPFTVFALGETWRPMAPILALLACVGIIQALITTSATLLKSVGRSDVMLRWAVIRMVVYVSVFALTVGHGLTTLAFWYLVANIILFVPFQVETARTIGMRAGDWIGALLPPVVASALMAGAILGLGAAWPALSERASYVQLLVLVPAGMLVYAGALGGLFRGYILGLAGQARSNLRPGSAAAP